MKKKPLIRRIYKHINDFLYLLTGLQIVGRPSFMGLFRLIKDKKTLQNQDKEINKLFPISKLYPCYQDKEDNAGSFHQYFVQDLYVAQQIFRNNPVKHVDIGSRVDGFIAHVASFREIEVLDIRPLTNRISNVTFKQMDLMDSSQIIPDYTASISSLHAMEHFGLGRYGDPLDIHGFTKGFENITTMLKKGGTFYFSVPLGKQRIEFHAHRVFSLNYLVPYINNYYTIQEFSYIDDDDTLHENVSLSENKEDIDKDFGCNLGCAIFTLVKK